ncbi:LysR family transcriptional regulator [Saccharopolyspora sp. TS4A08]|uniref:LysR family transcriptional regulator n=1 Tax=Saccharopolyspora ipomoeae TaxID=3042027 RepID=A0ABT6PI78_9PSEU|nr:LysR family transcriptional regulator [Saccharopolyspora sp. TS4A08]MDI2027706.1 LysR family transcriptional regulator [Saccharopolyspora sp. TS4A08]
MELRIMRYFVAVAEAGSVSEAARRVHVTQPALSRQLRAWERELRLTLFDRRDGRLELSAAGREFLPVVRDVLQRADAARAAAESLAAGRLVNLAIAASPTTLTDVIAPFLATFGPDDPMPTVQEAGGQAALDRLERGADLAVITQRPPDSWSSRTLAVLPLWAYVPPEHPWTARDSVSLDELAEQPLVVLDPTFGPRRLLDQALADRRLAPAELVECGNAQVAQALTAAGRGVAVVSDDPRFDLHPLRINRPGHDDLSITLHAVWNPAHHAAVALSDVADRLRAFCHARYPQS